MYLRNGRKIPQHLIKNAEIIMEVDKSEEGLRFNSLGVKATRNARNARRGETPVDGYYEDETLKKGTYILKDEDGQEVSDIKEGKYYLNDKPIKVTHIKKNDNGELINITVRNDPPPERISQSTGGKRTKRRKSKKGRKSKKRRKSKKKRKSKKRNKTKKNRRRK